MNQLWQERRALVIGLAMLLVTAAIVTIVLLAHRTSAPTPTPAGATPPNESASPTGGAVAYGTAAEGSVRLEELPVTVEAEDDASDGASPATEQRQTITGFGAALTQSSAELLLTLGESERDGLLRELFAPDGPVRLGVVRVALGGSDFVTEPATTYDDLPAGEPDWDLEHFSTAGDEDAIRPVLREILAIAPDVVVIASPWSPPAWLKSTGSLEGGTLLDDPRAVPTYARYLLAAVREYRAAGTPIDYLTVQNEPQARTPDGYPGTDMPAATQTALIAELGPLLAEHDLEIQLLAYDHNWSLHPADRATTPKGRDPEQDYPFDVLAGAQPWVAGVAYHCYYGDAASQSDLHAAYLWAQIWVTECSGSHAPGAPPTTVFADTLAWQSTNLMIASLQHWATGVLTWNLALDEDGGPHLGGCSTCTGVVTIADGEVTRNAEYYVLAHAARFLPRGSNVLETPAAESGPMPQVTARTPDGALVVLAYNPDDTAYDLAVRDTDRIVTVQVAPRSLVTLTTADLAPDSAPVPVRDVPLVAVQASPEQPEDPCCTDDIPARAADGDRDTRWSSGHSQQAGDWLQVELDDSTHVTQLVLDSGAWSQDWPRLLSVLASPDGETWDEAATDVHGDGSVLAVELDVEARFLRVELTGDADPWWSVAQVSVRGTDP